MTYEDYQQFDEYAHGPDCIMVGDLVTLADAAQRLSVQENTIQRWAERRDHTRFPSPIYSFKKTRIYSMAAIWKWHEIWTFTRRKP